MSAIYDSLAAGYAAPPHRRFYGRVVSELVGLGGAVPRGRGLDLACGVGASTAALRGALPEVRWVGLDCSAGMLARCREQRELSDVPLVAATAERLPFAAGSLDLVVCSFALHWMDRTALGEIARVLAADGRLLLAAPLRSPAPRLAGNRLWARTLLRERRRLGGVSRAGFSLGELGRALVRWRIHRVRPTLFVERYRAPADLAASLTTRGALAALFGPHAAEVAARFEGAPVPGPIEFGWPVALVAASAPAAR